MTSPQPHLPPHPPDPTTTAARTCREVIDFLMAYVDGDLRPEQQREFDRHLAVCPSCVNYLNSYKATVRMGKAAMRSENTSVAGSVPESLARAVREARMKGKQAHDVDRR